MDPKQLSWIRITKNPSNSIFENTRNKNIKSLMSNKRIYVENLVLLTFKSVLRILYIFFYGTKLFIFFNSTFKGLLQQHDLNTLNVQRTIPLHKVFLETAQILKL